MVRAAATCSVCSAPAASYKCPSCAKPYCSVACCRKHKEEACQQTTDQSNASAALNGDATTVNGAAAASGEGSAVRDAADHGKGRGNARPRRAFEDDGNDEETLWRLNASHLRAIADDDALRMQLRNHHLQRILTVVDSASDPQIALETASDHPLFAQFLQQLRKHLPGAAAITAEEQQQQEQQLLSLLEQQ